MTLQYSSSQPSKIRSSKIQCSVELCHLYGLNELLLDWSIKSFSDSYNDKNELTFIKMHALSERLANRQHPVAEQLVSDFQTVFLLLAELSGNKESAKEIHRLNEKLFEVRLIEAQLFDGLEVTLNEFLQHFQQQDYAGMRYWIKQYHQERYERADELIAQQNTHQVFAASM